MSEDNKTEQTGIDLLKEQTKQHIREVLGLTFSDWSDETMQKFDPAMSTLQLTLRDIYTNPNLDQGRVEVVLNAVNGLLKEPDKYKESNLNVESTQDLRLFTVFIKVSPWLLGQATSEDFSSFIDLIKKRELPQCLTSDAEVDRLQVKFGNTVSVGDQHMFQSQAEPGRLQPIRTFGESHVRSKETAADSFLEILNKDNSLKDAIGQITQQLSS